MLGGRPLFAAHAALEWPETPLLELWHAQTLLREFRGDGHVAALVAHGVDPLEALVLHAAAEPSLAAGLQATRSWPAEDWSDTVAQLAARRLVTADGTAMLEDGAALRQLIEDTTDQLAAPAYAVLGDEGCRRLRALGRPLSLAVTGAGLLPAP